MGDGKKGDEQTQAEIDIVGRRLAGWFREVNAVAPEITIKRPLAIQNEVGNRTMKERHQQPEYQIGEIGNHTSSLAICLHLPIRRRT